MYIISKIHLAALWWVDWRGQDGRCNSLGEKLWWQRKEMSKSRYKLLPQNLRLKTLAFIQLTLLLDSSLGLWQAIGLIAFACVSEVTWKVSWGLTAQDGSTYLSEVGWLLAGWGGEGATCLLSSRIIQGLFTGQRVKRAARRQVLTGKCFFNVCWCRIGQSNHKSNPDTGVEKDSTSWWEKLPRHIASAQMKGGEEFVAKLAIHHDGFTRQETVLSGHWWLNVGGEGEVRVRHS